MSRIVLITGSAGQLGQGAVREFLARGWTVRGFDLVPTPHASDLIVGDITDGPAVRQAARGADAIVHLAATPDDDDFLTKLLPPNIIGVYEILEAAREAGIRRVVLASSGQVVWGQRFTGPFPIGVDTLPTPRGWYAVTKVFAEAAGKVYAQTYEMDVIAARLGWCPRSQEHADELANTEWGPDAYLSAGDGGRFFAGAVETPGPLGFRVVYVLSRPVAHSMCDVETTRTLLGYEPQHRYPDGLGFEAKAGKHSS